jgi:hypothetical protein
MKFEYKFLTLAIIMMMLADFSPASSLLETREFYEYSRSETNFCGVEIKALLDGKYRSGEQKTVTNPYKLLVFFGDKIKEEDVEIISFRLSDQSGINNIVNQQHPILNMEKRNIGTGTLNYIKITDLNLSYVDYRLILVFKIHGEEKEITLNIPTAYKKKTVNPWWEKASGI